MSQQVLTKPRIFGFISTSAHPVGCAREVRRQIEVARSIRKETPSGGRMLVLGATMGYGLAARIMGTFTCGMDSLGVGFERPARAKRTATAGWYNTAEIQKAAAEEGLIAPTIMGDAFSKETLEETLDRLEAMGPIDQFIYSLAAPRRKDPVTGEVYTGVLKAIGENAKTKVLNLKSGHVDYEDFSTATDEEVRQTVKVMGGEDLKRWVDALLERKLLKPGAKVLAFSYIGPKVTHALYRDGSIGQAKRHLETTCLELNERLQKEIGGCCHTVVAKSIVTQSSAAIPAISLYISLVFRVMKEMNLHEDAVRQMMRLYRDHLQAGQTPTLDDQGRIRIDDWELREDVQAEVMRRWNKVDTPSLEAHADLMGYNEDFLRIFGFGLADVNYDKLVETEVDLSS
jgi:enoyl-[acyl-carrier protein] reductase / trans-2-enoyl-CoA reductase (NAD+)